ncbi:MAG TPA: glycosyltransferase family 9 protein [Candidatus Krumholzibacteria bacterium]
MSARDNRDWVLVIRLRQLGDVLASLEVMRALKAHRPERGVALVVNAAYAPLVEHEPYIDRVLVPPARGTLAWARFLRDVRALSPSSAIDLHGSARAALITLASGARQRVGYDLRLRRRAYTVVEPRGEFTDGRRVPHNPITWGFRLARHAGCDPVSTLPPELRVDDDTSQRARDRLRAAGLSADVIARRGVIALNPGRPVPSKSWPVERFIDLSRRLRAAGHPVMVFWGPGEEVDANRIARESGAVCAPSLSLPEMVGALRSCAVLVTIDSGLKHLAVCARTPTVTLFGSTDPREWHMGAARDALVWKGLSCSPCRRLLCPFGTPCMDIGVDEVVAMLAHSTGEAA